MSGSKQTKMRRTCFASELGDRLILPTPVLSTTWITSAPCSHRQARQEPPAFFSDHLRRPGQSRKAPPFAQRVERGAGAVERQKTGGTYRTRRTAHHRHPQRAQP